MPHPVHAAWAAGAGLELHAWLPRAAPYATLWLRDLAAARAMPRCGVAVAEGGGPAGACGIAKLLRIADHAVLLAADETWARLRRGVPGPLPGTERAWDRVVGRLLDGAIAVSPYVAEDLQALFPRLPVRVVRPHVLPDARARLAKLAPTLEAPRLLHLASTVDKNGTRIAVEAFARVREALPEAALHLVGTGSEAWSGPGVVAHGRVPDLAPHLEAASLFVLPGLGQACPVSTLEAMVAGVPTLVSTETGTKDLVAGVDEGLVVEPAVAPLAEAMLRYLELPPEERQRLGAAARRAVAGLTAEAQTAAFAGALRDLAGA